MVMTDTTQSAATQGGDKKTVKYFVLDTNVLLHNSDALFVFEDNHVVVPYTVIEELDALKRREDDVGRNARACIRYLDKLRVHGRLTEGVAWGEVDLGPEINARKAGDKGTGTVRVDTLEHDRPAVIEASKPDNRIIASALSLKKEGLRAVFVTKDLAARIKADVLGITTEDFENQKVDGDRLYKGYVEVDAPGTLIDQLYDDRLLSIEALSDTTHRGLPESAYDPDQLLSNEFVLLYDATDEHHTGLCRRPGDVDQLIPVTGPRKPITGIMARNLQQTMALDLLLDDQVKLVTLLGAAGTGKTLLALAAAMTKVLQEERYEKLLAARPIMPMGRDIGYLPGDKDEKLAAWMQPIFDNLAYLMSTKGSPDQSADSRTSEQRIQRLMVDGKMVLEPLTYIRGRSIPHQFMIVDEAQNLTPHEVKTIVSRVGEGTKLVLTGDIGQIDNPYLDQSSNGLSYLVEKLKGEPLFGHVTLARSERSDLASLAAKRL